MKEKIHSEKLRKRKLKQQLIGVIVGFVVGVLTFILTRSWISTGVGFILAMALSFLYFYSKRILKKTARIKKMELIFPDFLQLMASNLRAGITIDKAMLLASREEFEHLNKEIMETGRDIEEALKDMAKRIGSEKITKTILLIISGIKSGGNIAILLEETATNMKQRGFVEKRAASSVLMYVIFIFVAVAAAAPALFALSTVLVEILTDLLGNLPSVSSSSNLPFTISSINISTEFVKYFSIVFIIVVDVLASLVLGLVSKGEEKEGIKYILPLLIISLSVFFLIRIFLSGFLAGFF